MTPTYFPSIGGIEQVVRDLALFLGSDEVRTEVAHVSTSNKRYSLEIVDGIQVHRIPLYGHRLLGLAPDLRRFADYDLAHLHDPQVSALTHSAAIFLPKVPRILSTHGGFRHTNRFPLLKWMYERLLLAKLLRLYRLVIASSLADEAYFSSYSASVVRIDNGVNFNRIGYSPPSGHSFPRLSRWIYWGRIASHKRVDLVIEQAARMRAKGFDIQLMICGQDFDGTLQSIQSKVTKGQQEGWLKHCALLTDPQLRDLARSCGIYISATEYEGFGLSFVEALSAGLLVLCRDISPINDFVADGLNGALIDFTGTDEENEKVARLMGKDQESLAAAYQISVERTRKYDWNSVILQFRAQYALVLQNDNASRSRTTH